MPAHLLFIERGGIPEPAFKLVPPMATKRIRNH